MPTQQSDAMGTALKQEKLKGYITALGEDDLPRSGLVLLYKIDSLIIYTNNDFNLELFLKIT